jgi:hypothetical protein
MQTRSCNEPIKEEPMQIDDSWTTTEGTEELDVAQVDWCLGVDTRQLAAAAAESHNRTIDELHESLTIWLAEQAPDKVADLLSDWLRELEQEAAEEEADSEAKDAHPS